LIVSQCSTPHKKAKNEKISKEKITKMQVADDAQPTNTRLRSSLRLAEKLKTAKKIASILSPTKEIEQKKTRKNKTYRRNCGKNA